MIDATRETDETLVRIIHTWRDTKLRFSHDDLYSAAIRETATLEDDVHDDPYYHLGIEDEGVDINTLTELELAILLIDDLESFLRTEYQDAIAARDALRF